MCLYIKDTKTQIARNDITCYKVMMKRRNGAVCTPFKLSHPSPDVLSGYANFKASRTNISANKLIESINVNSWFYKHNTDYTSQVGEGFIHTYMFASHAVEDMGIECFARKDYLLYKCVIPKGTEYVVGDNGSYPCYASREIKFEGIID